MRRRPPRSPLVPYTTLFRSRRRAAARAPRRRPFAAAFRAAAAPRDRKSTRLNSSHTIISYAVFCLKKEEIFGGPWVRLLSSDGSEWFPGCWLCRELLEPAHHLSFFLNVPATRGLSSFSLPAPFPT